MSIEQTHMRQLGIVNPELLSFPITIIGVGGLGSWAAISLAKLGCSEITVIDHDYVETHNIASQFYDIAQVGTSKAEAIAENAAIFSSCQIRSFSDSYQRAKGKIIPGGVILCLVDSLEERRKIWEDVKTTDYLCFIDGRMGGELLRILTVNPMDERMIRKYEKSLDKKPEEIATEECGARAVVYNTLFAGGIFGVIIKKIAMKEEIPTDIIFDATQLSIYKGGEK